MKEGSGQTPDSNKSESNESGASSENVECGEKINGYLGILF